MKLNLGTKKIFDRQKDDEEPNPMEGVANMADVMLVLAVGIMLALIINWRVDLTKNPAQDQQSIGDTSNGYITQQEEGEPIGIVYEREDGSLYYVVDEPSETPTP
ncbi:MAG: DUF2149 domain-containing protein [Eubacteriales bacterium]|nr:DUF2149 domain-containing protein [Eubacteriales bacterium]